MVDSARKDKEQEEAGIRRPDPVPECRDRIMSEIEHARQIGRKERA